MIEILEKIQDFKISTPMKGSRKISFKRPFEDIEFSDYKLQDNKLCLIKDEEVLTKLSFNKSRLEGSDSRGGVTELHPDMSDLEEFKDYFKVVRVSKPLVTEPEVNFEGKITIVSNNNHEGYPVVPPRGRLYDIYDKLFSNGVELILNFTDCNVKPNAIDLLIELSKQYLNDKVGSVQVCSRDKTGSANQLSEENGDWYGYAINLKTWLKIRQKMKSKEFNFKYGLKMQFIEKKLIRLSCNMSRCKYHDIQDGRRKHFEVVKNENS